MFLNNLMFHEYANNAFNKLALRYHDEALEEYADREEPFKFSERWLWKRALRKIELLEVAKTPRREDYLDAIIMVLLLMIRRGVK